MSERLRLLPARAGKPGSYAGRPIVALPRLSAEDRDELVARIGLHAVGGLDDDLLSGDHGSPRFDDFPFEHERLGLARLELNDVLPVESHELELLAPELGLLLSHPLELALQPLASLELNPIVIVPELDEEALGEPDFTRLVPYFGGRSRDQWRRLGRLLDRLSVLGRHASRGGEGRCGHREYCHHDSALFRALFNSQTTPGLALCVRFFNAVRSPIHRGTGRRSPAFGPAGSRTAGVRCTVLRFARRRLADN